MPPAGVFSGSLKGRLALATCTFRPQRVFGMRVFGMHVIMIVVMMPVIVPMMVMVMAVPVIMPVVMMMVVMPHIQSALSGAEKITVFTVRHV